MEIIKTDYGYKKVYASGDKLHFNNKDQLHNPNGPAIEWINGYKEYRVNGALHNPNGPAIEYINGGTEYYVNGVKHRTDGPAVENINGCKLYYKNGKLHNTHGFAVITKKHKLNFLNGKYVWKS